MEKKTADKAKILIVDDDPVRLQLLKRAMAKSGKELIAAMGGHEALQKLRELQSVDLIITDRGFLFGAGLVRELRLVLTVIRKKGKLPRKCASVVAPNE